MPERHKGLPCEWWVQIPETGAQRQGAWEGDAGCSRPEAAPTPAPKAVRASEAPGESSSGDSRAEAVREAGAGHGDEECSAAHSSEDPQGLWLVLRHRGSLGSSWGSPVLQPTLTFWGGAYGHWSKGS